jgi:single-strand DNA-binding protein
MLNQAILVGRLAEEPVLKTLPDGSVKSNIVLDIIRSYRNPDTGDYDSDSIPITLWEGIAKNTVEHCLKGATIGVKARIEVTGIDVKLVAEKITFINTKGKK